MSKIILIYLCFIIPFFKYLIALHTCFLWNVVGVCKESDAFICFSYALELEHTNKSRHLKIYICNSGKHWNDQIRPYNQSRLFKTVVERPQFCLKLKHRH